MIANLISALIVGTGVIIFLANLLGLLIGPMSGRRRQTKAGPRPIDPQNPPYQVVFVRADGDPEVRCVCHNRPLVDWQQVVCWPQPPQFLCAEEMPK